MGLPRVINYSAGIIKPASATVTNFKFGNRTKARVESTVPYSHDVDRAPLAQAASKSSLENAGWMAVLRTALSRLGI